MKFCELKPEEFGRFALKVPGNNLFQSHEMYNRYVDNPGFESYLLGVKDGQKIVLAALVVRMSAHRLPLVGEQKIFAAIRGPLMDYNRPDAREILQVFFHGSKKFLGERGGAALRISPNVVLRPRDNDGEVAPEDDFQKNHEFLLDWFSEMGLKNLGEYGIGKWLYAIDIEGKTADELFREFRKGLRYDIKWAKDRYGVTLREVDLAKDAESAEVFGQILKETEDRQGFNEQRTESWRTQTARAFGSKLKCYIAEVPEGADDSKNSDTPPKPTQTTTGSVPIAVGMFSMYGDEATYLLAGSRKEYQKYGAPSLIIWTAIEYAVAHKMKMVNLYGAKPERGNKLFEFKRGFRGHALELVGTFVLPITHYGKLYTKRKKYVESIL